MTFPKTRTLVPGTRRTGLTWRLTAGLGMSWGERATLDLAPTQAPLRSHGLHLSLRYEL